jgi:hypothetical protein
MEFHRLALRGRLRLSAKPGGVASCDFLGNPSMQYSATAGFSIIGNGRESAAGSGTALPWTAVFWTAASFRRYRASTLA